MRKPTPRLYQPVANQHNTTSILETQGASRFLKEPRCNSLRCSTCRDLDGGTVGCGGALKRDMVERPEFQAHSCR